MKKLVYLLFFTFIICFSPSLHSDCFLIKKGTDFLVDEGDYKTRHAPCCTFNLALSLMGFDKKILLDSERPEWPYKPHYNASRDILKQPHHPRSWMRNSSVWFSQVLLEQLTIDTVKEYLSLLNYGNQNTLGYKKRDHDQLPLPFWISSSLEISPLEQIEFLEKLVNSRFKLSESYQALTRDIAYLEELSPGWKLYGKTGAGNKIGPDGVPDENGKYGWFIGWLENAETKLLCVRYLEDDTPGSDYPSSTAKEQVKEKLQTLIKGM